MTFNTEQAIIEIRRTHNKIRSDIESRLEEFRQAWAAGSDEDVFAELTFCLFTPQSKARSCWAAVECLQTSDLLMNGSQQDIAATITGVRFHNTKAGRVVRAREQFFSGGRSLRSTIAGFSSPGETREWLVENINGFGYKEASHFLRNLGMGGELAILDRHILRNLVPLGVIGEVPTSISRKNYLEIEQKMAVFSQRIKIPMAHLDLVLWYREAGEIFK